MSNTQFRLFSIPPLPFHALARAESWTGRLMAVYGRSDEMREQHQRCDVKSCLLLNLSADFTAAFDYYNGLQARPIVRLLEPFGIVDHRGHFGFDAVAIGIDPSMLTDFAVLEANGLLLGDEELDILTQRALVAFQRENVISLLVDDLCAMSRWHPCPRTSR